MVFGKDTTPIQRGMKGKKHSEATKEDLKQKMKGKNKGDKSGNWKGGTKIESGYVLTLAHFFPTAHKKEGYVKRCHLVWFAYTREIIENPYILHHINENRQDDRFENLQKMTRKEHIKLHEVGKDTHKKLKRDNRGRFLAWWGK